MKEFVEQRIVGVIRELLTKRVNEILRDEEFDTPFVEFGNYQSGDCVVPVIALAKSERTEKERIVRLDAYSLTVAFSLPQTFESELHCYAITAAVALALKENPTLDGVADRAVVTGEKYVPPKLPLCGQGWEVTVSLRITVEEIAHGS